MTPTPNHLALERIAEFGVVPLDLSDLHTLSLDQKIAAFHFAQAARCGDRITFDQRNRFHLPMLWLLEDIVVARPPLAGDLIERIECFLKQMWLFRGNHHPDSTLKVLPEFDRLELRSAAKAAKARGASFLLPAGVDLEAQLKALDRAFFDSSFQHQLVCKSPPPGEDVVSASSCNFYAEGIREEEVIAFEGAHGLNSRLARVDGQLMEQIYRAGDAHTAPGLYAGPMAAIATHLEAAFPHLPETQQRFMGHLVRHFRTGDLEAFRDYYRGWIRSDVEVDVIIGFIEQYLDPMGHRGEFEATVHTHDHSRKDLMQRLAQQAAYFESRMPWDPAYCRTHIEVSEAQISNMLVLGGSTSPFGYSGVNLPNETRLQETHGTKSLLINNVVKQRQQLVGETYFRAFCSDGSSLERAGRCGSEAWDAFVALHEVIGHASGRVSPELKGDPEDHLHEYAATLEEARADLVALWHILDPKLVEIGLVQTKDVAEEAFSTMLRGALITIGRLHEPIAEEDHDRAELLIVNYLRDRTEGVLELERDGEVYWDVRSVHALREGAGTLLSQIMRIKAHGDYEGIRTLVERYGVHVDAGLHRGLRARIKRLGVPERIGFISPKLALQRDKSGAVVDVVMAAGRDWKSDQLAISRQYRQLLGR